jgi:hypothetical protein
MSIREKNVEKIHTFFSKVNGVKKAKREVANAKEAYSSLKPPRAKARHSVSC